MFMKELIIIGASGHGRVIADMAQKLNQWTTIAFLDDDDSLRTCLGYPVIGKVEEALGYIDRADFVVAIGNNEIRSKFQQKLEVAGGQLATLIHPQASVGLEVRIGAGTVVMAGSVINTGSSLGKGCIVNTGATVDHDNRLGDYVHLSPGVHLAGTVTIGEMCWLGIGSIVSNNLRLSSHVQLGAGAVVVEDLLESGLYLGVPARRKTE